MSTSLQSKFFILWLFIFQRNIEQISFVNLVSFARIFFDLNATAEMLEEWRPLICPFDMSMNDAYERFNLFLPTLFPEHDASTTYE